MRRAFVETLTAVASKDERIWLLTADLGFGAIESFAQTHPKRFLNMGVSEQNMLAVATGLAESGFIPFCYSIAPFAALRPYEFIRNGPVLQGLPVRIVGIGGGVEYGYNGPTHHGLEDLGVMRLLQDIEVYAPADSAQARNCVEATWDRPSPIYYRFGKNEDPRVPGLDGRFRVGFSETVQEGDSVLLLSIGAISFEAAEAAALLKASGISVQHQVLSGLNPFAADIADMLKRYSWVVTVESHRSSGALGSAVCELSAASGKPCKVLRLGLDFEMQQPTGSQKHYYQICGLMPDQIAERVRRFVGL